MFAAVIAFPLSHVLRYNAQTISVFLRGDVVQG